MKTLLTLLLLTLACFLYQCYASSHLFNQQGGCCPESINRTVVPRNKVKHVGMTPDNCPKASTAIVVTDCNGRKYCFVPTMAWAKRLLRDFKKSTAKTTSPQAPFNQC